VLVLVELSLGLGADSLRGRVWGEAFREILFDFLELAEQLVVFRVRDGRTVENVILVRSADEVGPELRRPTMLLLTGLARTPRSLLVGAGTLGWFLPRLL
jgi:hypothetical protein